MRKRGSIDDQLTAQIARNSVDLFRYLERRMGTDDAADALADVMLAAWRRAASLPADAEQARMWLFGIARNVNANATRTGIRRSALANQLRESLSVAQAQTPSADDGMEVRDAIARLSPEKAELVRLIHWDGFTVAEAGEILGIGASTARSRYQRTREELKLALTAPTRAEKTVLR